MKTIAVAQGAEEAVEEPAEHVSSLQPDIPPSGEHARHTQVRLMLEKITLHVHNISLLYT